MDPVTNPPLLPRPPAPAEDGSGTDVAAASADFSSFLRLLTAQLRNQDPLQPLDPTQFVAQLASFSTVEQLIGANGRLDGLAARADAEAAARYAGWIDRAASVVDGSFRGTGEPVPFAYAPAPGADRSIAAIRRADGSAVATLELDPSAAGEAVWDGLDATGAPALGPLRIEIAHFQGETLLAQQAATVPRIVAGVRGTADGVLIDFADGGTARPEEIAALRAPPAEEEG